MDDAAYFRFADRIVARLEPTWSRRRHAYLSGGRSVDTIYNSALLTVLATAAEHGHVGPGRNDARARRLTAALLRQPPYWTGAVPPRPDQMFHTPGWTSNMRGGYVDMDKSIDPKVAEALTAAWRARDVLRLGVHTRRRIARQIRAVAYGPFFRFPAVRLNQVNWPAELYLRTWEVTGDATLLRRDYRQQLRRFVAGVRSPWTVGGAPNLGRSYHFHYQNNQVAGAPRNLDSPEYANITLHALYAYPEALAVGMRPLGRADVRVLRRWIRRALFGYWTHAGFLNWDTGWGYDRWMHGKTWAYAQQGLLAIARTGRLGQGRRYTRWAKTVFDRGLRLYTRLGPQAKLFGIGDAGQGSEAMFAARMAANAARAVTAGLGGIEPLTPPPFYAFDADNGRLAVSTPAYATAILAVSRGIVPYGGQELARLYDADGDPISGTGSHPPHAFGLVVRDADGRRLVATQTGLLAARRPPLTLTESPRGPVRHLRALTASPDAGPFHRLAVSGVRRAAGVVAISRYRFAPAWIDAHWTLHRPPGCRCTAALHFPTWGRLARVERTGRRSFRLRSARGSYAIRLRAPVGRRVRVLPGVPQRPNPRTGPTLELALPSAARIDIRARIVPSSDGGARNPRSA